MVAGATIVRPPRGPLRPTAPCAINWRKTLGWAVLQNRSKRDPTCPLASATIASGVPQAVGLLLTRRRSPMGPRHPGSTGSKRATPPERFKDQDVPALRIAMRQFLSIRPCPSGGTRAWPAFWMVHTMGLWLVLCGFLSPALAIGPSFDCAKVRTPLAQFICSIPTLSKLDLEFVQSYYALRQQVGPNGWQSLKVEAVNFETRAMQQCGISPSGTLPSDRNALQQCLIETYEAQAENWRSRLRGPALEEASRPIEQHIALQARLQTLGFLPGTATIDGVYGSATRDAIAAWQKASGLPASGFLDNADANRLATSSMIAAGAGGSEPTLPAEAGGQAQLHLIPMSDLATIYARTHQ